jgi:hypothetical protein
MKMKLFPIEAFRKTENDVRNSKPLQHLKREVPSLDQEYHTNFQEETW